MDSMAAARDDGDRVAILVLARSPRVEARLKNLERTGGGAGSRLFDASLRRTLAAARAAAPADLHVAVAPEDRNAARRAVRVVGAKRFLQDGNTFGERVANAVDHLRASGYSRVVVLAGDCPGIRRHHVVTAVASLAAHSVVLGPSGDGGLYLLGLDAAALDRVDLRAMPWLTSQVGDALARSAAQESLPLERLDRLDDVDDPISAIELLRDLAVRFSIDATSIVALLREALRAALPIRPRATLAVVHHAHDVAIPWRRPPPIR